MGTERREEFDAMLSGDLRTLLKADEETFRQWFRRALAALERAHQELSAELKGE